MSKKKIPLHIEVNKYNCGDDCMFLNRIDNICLLFNEKLKWSERYGGEILFDRCSKCKCIKEIFVSDQCESINKITGDQCTLPYGHDGNHEVSVKIQGWKKR